MLERLGTIFEEVAMPNGLVANAITNDEILGAVNRHPTVMAIPDAGPDDRTAPHAILAEMEVDGVFAQHILLAQVPELRIRDRSF